VTPRPEFEVGVEIVSDYKAFWPKYFAQAYPDLIKIGANSLTLTPTWIWKDNSPLPVLEFDPNHTPYSQELAEVVRETYRQGLKVNLRGAFVFGGTNPQEWWQSAPKTEAWWTTWFDEYRSFILTLASQAAMSGAEKLILSGSEIAPALPEGLLYDGEPSGVPFDIEERWVSLIQEIRARFSGRLAFELEVGEKIQTPPSFLSEVDEIHLYWHTPLSDDEDPRFNKMQSTAGEQLDSALLALTSWSETPLVLSVEYLSIQLGASGCPRAIDMSCRHPSDFEQGADPDPDLEVDLKTQAKAINAVLLEAYARSRITGFYVRGYNPVVMLRDKSASIHGKAAQDILWYWYPRITGDTQ
jgi:hypothetical protein